MLNVIGSKLALNGMMGKQANQILYIGSMSNLVLPRAKIDANLRA